MLSDPLSISLAVAALLAGLTGTWSPCGFSMIETIGPAGHRGGPATTVSACVTFTLGALAGGVATFGTLALAGNLLQGGDNDLAYLVAAAVAICAAIAEIRGVRILPQVRRQLPEPWRRVMPMPIAAGLYGILLGLGFTRTSPIESDSRAFTYLPDERLAFVPTTSWRSGGALDVIRIGSDGGLSPATRIPLLGWSAAVVPAL